MNIEELTINTLKVNGVAAINKANSGHPGIVLGTAPMLYTLFTKHMNYDPKNPKWVNRDRFILSAGHGSGLLYAQLRIMGFLKEKDLKEFRQLNSLTPGHPEYRHTKGVESTTGPLGQGITIGVGMAVAEAHLSSKYSEINHNTYIICGDGDLQEGAALEALSFAGHQRLNKLIILHDSNDIQLDTAVSETYSGSYKEHLESLGFEYILVKNNTVKEIDLALVKAKKSHKPVFIEVKTIIGEGSPQQGTTDVHGAPLGKDIEILKKHLNWTKDEFFLPQEVTKHYQNTIFARGAKAFENFKASKELNNFLKSKKIKINLDLSKNVATRVSSGEVIQFLNKNVEQWIGGSADLSTSTKAKGGDGSFIPSHRSGRNINFGVREFAMAGIANGLSLHSNFKPFVSTFFVFSDYVKPAARLAALMELPITYIFTHDSIFVGEDGPTHQPIEHLAMLRSIPNFNTFRPADEKEVLGAYETALNSTRTPTAIVLTRQNIVSLNQSDKEKTKTGHYCLNKADSEWTLIASGSEVASTLNIAQKLKLNAVSIPLFNDKEITWNIQKAISIEAATTFGWSKYAKYNLGINTFGASGPAADVLKYFELDEASLEKKIETIINIESLPR